MEYNIFYEALASSIRQAYFKAFAKDEVELFFERPPKPDYGDISLACFAYAKILKKSPNQIAKIIADNIDYKKEQLTNIVQETTTLGPYLNFKFKVGFIAEAMFNKSNNNQLIQANLGGSKTIVIEFSAPNANKPLHLGHGRNNALGVFLVRLAKATGFNVKAVNLVNDRGIHICKSMLAYQLQGANQTPEQAGKKGDHFVGDYYVLFSKLAAKDPLLNQKAQQLLNQWENSNPDVLALWHKMTGWAVMGLKKTYQRAGIEFDKYYYESKTYQQSKDIVFKALKEGICQKDDSGAIFIDLEDVNLDKKILLRKDGTSVYITQDLYTTFKKFEDYKASKAFWVVGSEQEHYFKVLFATLKKLGILPGKEFEHVSYGMIELPDGKMKSREGTSIDLDKLYDEMSKKAYDLMQERQSDHLTNQEKLRIAEFLGQSAINFFILKSASNKNIVFDKKASLQLDGMSGPYLQYSFARICSLQAKAKQQGWKILAANFSDWNEEEASILKHSVFFEDTLVKSWQTKNPGLICHYVYDLCRMFNRFYYMHPVLSVKEEHIKTARLNLVFLVRSILEKCFYLLNIEPLERI